MTSAQWAELQASLDRRPQRRGMITAETALLTGVIFCGTCGGPMYRTKSRAKAKDGSVRTWFYYRCGGKDRRRSNCRNMIRLEQVDGWVDRWFTQNGPFADTELLEIDLHQCSKQHHEFFGNETVASDVKHYAVSPEPQLVPENASMPPPVAMKRVPEMPSSV